VNEQVPLTTLLSWAWVAYAIEVDNAVEMVGSEHVGRLFRISVAMWANGLRVIDEEGVTVDELQARAHARCNIGGLERWGWISVGDLGPRRRDGYGSGRGVKGSTVLRPTRAGSYARRLWPRMVGEVEQRWRGRFGNEVIGSLGEALRPRAGAMPWSPPQMSAGDGFYTHVVDGPVTGNPDPGTVADDLPDQQPPLVALMGQALTAATLEHERNAEVSLPMAADFLRVIGHGVVRARDVPALSGVSKEAIAMAINFLKRRHMAEPVSGGAMRLTNLGLDALDGYWARASLSTHEELRGPLTAVLSQPEALAEGLVPPPGCWRGEKPYLAQTNRVLAAPTASLPWHPTVLHRGGWPDGS
jgi:hypothetical protein